MERTDRTPVFHGAMADEVEVRHGWSRRVSLVSGEFVDELVPAVELRFVGNPMSTVVVMSREAYDGLPR